MKVALILTLGLVAMVAHAQNPKETLSYCGVEALLERGNPLSNGCLTNRPVAMTAAEFLASPCEGLDANEIEGVDRCVSGIIRFPMIQAEAAALVGDGELFWKNMEVAGAILEWSADKRTMCLNVGFRPNLYAMEYLLARIMCDRRKYTVKVTSDDVRRLLPEAICEVKPVPEGPGPKGAALSHNAAISFRNMLVVGCALEAHLRETGRMPARLDQLPGLSESERKDAYGVPFEFRTKDTEWELLSIGWTRFDTGLKDMAFGGGIPVIAGISGPCSDTVWLSSMYHKKRVELFEKKILNAGTRFQCRLLPHLILREGCKELPDSRQGGT